MTPDRRIVVRPEIAEAVASGLPVVALESTVIAHGLPHPHNLDVATGMEREVRNAGAIPATIAIMRGKLTVGLNAEEIEDLANARPGMVRKASRRDLAIAIANGETAATTVAATMIGAHIAGISVFATGGIGGVHRGTPFDISADLRELGRTPIAVICSGPKAILDIPATREVLETEGVPVIGYETDELPAFYSRSSGFAVDSTVNSPEEAARIIQAQHALRIEAGMIFAVPVPEDHALSPEDVDAAITKATEESKLQNISGGEVTPFVLARVSELTGHAALHANTALLLNNARVAGEIASAFSKFKKNDIR